MEWISVEDRLPEGDVFVDVYCKSKENPDYGRRKTGVAFINSKFDVSLYGDIEYVSHWMPLPARPLDKT